MDVAMVFLDISRAFDRVWHNGLTYILKCFGVAGSLLKWIIDYLSSRQQRVVLAGHESSFLGTNAGVPQGSILGPLLFLIFLNDTENDIDSDLFIFADDTTLARSYSDLCGVESCLGSDLDKISVWASEGWLTSTSQKLSSSTSALNQPRNNLSWFLMGR